MLGSLVWTASAQGDCFCWGVRAATSVRLEVVLLARLPTRVPEAHLGCLGGSSDRPCISWLTVRGLGTGLGALDFLHQMAKPPMSLEQRGRAGRKPMLCEAGAERVLRDP